MGSVKITAVPAGEAPLWVRKSWFGLVLPCEPIVGFSGEEKGALSGGKTENRYGFNVPQHKALEILGKQKPQAATWWKEHGFPQKDMFFVFDESEAEIIQGVRRQKLHVYDDVHGWIL